MFGWFYEKKQALLKKIAEKGQGIVEYALILAAVAIIAIYVLGSEGGLTSAVNTAYSGAADKINSATNMDPADNSGSGGGGGGGGGS